MKKEKRKITNNDELSMKRAADSEMNEHELKTIAAFFDGELSGLEKHSFQTKLKNGDSLLTDELESYKLVQQTVRDWFHEQTFDEKGKPREVYLWEKIVQEITPLADKRRNGGWIDRLFEQVKTGLELSLRPRLSLVHVASIASVAALLVLYQSYSFYVGRGVSTRDRAGSGIEYAQNATWQGPTPNNKSPDAEVKNSVVNVRLVANSSRPGMPLFLPERTASGYQEMLRRYQESIFKDSIRKTQSQLNSDQNNSSENPSGENSVLAMNSLESSPTQQNDLQVQFPVQDIIDQNFILGGLRAEGADIDWVKSGRTLNIFSTEDNQAPPVIWVAQQDSENNPG